MVRIPRDYKKSRYYIAFFFTLAVFIIGLMVGIIISTQRTSYLEEAVEIQKSEYESLQLQSLFLSTAQGHETCAAFTKTLEKNLNKLEDDRKKLESYILQNDFENYELVKRNYILSEIRYWLLAKQTKDLCERTTTSILYFYSNVDGKCPDCTPQGLILSYIKKEFGSDVLIFAMDGDFTREPMVEILKEYYQVTEYPAIVIEDESYKGLQTKEFILQELCDNGLSNHEACTA